MVSPEASRGAKCIDMTSPRLPIVTYLVGLGNDINADAAETIPSSNEQSFRDCRMLLESQEEAAKPGRSKVLARAHMRTCKIEHVNSICGRSSATARRWQVIGHYERCWCFFRDSQKVKGASGKTLLCRLRRVVYEGMRLQEAAGKH